ncbi:MAG: GNAT family N-acetyltransferase [bacterium]
MPTVRTPSEFRVRPAAERDLPDLARMRRALQELIAECDPGVWALSPEMLATLEKFYAGVMASDTGRVFVAADPDDRPVGMLIVRIIDNPNMDPRPIGRIDDAWVEPKYRRRGLMRALTGACCRFLAGRDVPVVMLDWALRNEPSVRCWQGLGFEPRLAMGFTTPAAVLAGKGESSGSDTA